MTLELLFSWWQTCENYMYFQLTENTLYYSIAIAAIVGKSKEASKRNVFSAWIMYFTGTLFHELSHLLISFLTYGKPTYFSLLPSTSVDKESGKKSITLGYVESKNIQWWNVFFISMAPLLLLPLSFYVYENFFNYFDQTLWSTLFYIFFIVSLLFSAIPSDIDLSHVFNAHTPINLLVPGLILFIAYEINIEHINILKRIFNGFN